MTKEVSILERADLHTLVREGCRTQAAATDRKQAEEFALEVGRVVAECAFECAVETGGTRAGYGGAHLPGPGGQRARFVGYRRRWVRGQPGEGEVTRADYHCRECGPGHCPWDREQGLDPVTLTPLLKARVAALCGRLVFREAPDVRESFPGLSLAVRLLEEGTEPVGGRLRAAETERVRRLFEANVFPPADPFLTQLEGKRGYLCGDAAKAHPDGSGSRKPAGKVAAFFPGAPPPKQSPPRPRKAPTQEPLRTWDAGGPARALARQEEAAPFGRRRYTFALRLGSERVRELVLRGDGAESGALWALETGPPPTFPMPCSFSISFTLPSIGGASPAASLARRAWKARSGPKPPPNAWKKRG